MADDGCEAAPYSRDCPGEFDLYRRSDRAVESLAGTAYSADIRAWPCLSRRLVRLHEATGTVKWFNPTKGYGFIQPQDGGRDVFVHISAVERAGLSSLNEGQTVDYEIVSNRGKQSAENIKVR